MQPGPYSLQNRFTNPFARPLVNAAIGLVERALALRHLNSVYFAGAAAAPSAHFSDGALGFLNASYDANDARLAGIPATGPLIVVANHPFGGVDGLVLNSLLRRVRSDVKLFGSIMLQRMEAYRHDFFFVDNFGAPDAPARNLSATKAAIRWLKAGGCLGVFPAGEVSHLTIRRRHVTDGPWSTAIARLAQASGAAVLPLFFDGHNSALFQLAGLIHPKLRTILLAREVKKRRNTEMRFAVGSVIPGRRICKFESAASLTEYLRLRTYILRARMHASCDAGTPRHAGDARIRRRHDQPIADAPAVELLEREIAALPPAHFLGDVHEYAVHYAAAGEIPSVLHEIGRLREHTFRRVGEGTGRAVDLDEFDADYLHLFVWNRERKQIVGAYRLGLSDEIIDRRGISGLYTSTLFKYRRALLDEMGPAIELGRSFVRPEYQKEYAPLMLLWRGISRFIAAHPRYKIMFGPVSISNDYQSLSKHLLMEFLKENGAAPDLQKLVTPRNPPKFGHFREIERELAGTSVKRIEDVDELVSEIESDRAAMPILLRQYLKLNAKLLAFNVDPDFGDVLDGLMLADLTKVDRPMLMRYMGRENAEAFLKYWQEREH